MMNRNRINKFIQQHSSGDKNVGNLVRQILWSCDFEIIRDSKHCVHNDCVCTITVYTRAGVREKYYYARTARVVPQAATQSKKKC